MSPAKYLASRDKVLGALLRKKKVVVPKRDNNYFRFLVVAILNQQLSTKAAATIRSRFVALFPGKKFPNPQDVLNSPAKKLRSAGMSRAKVGFVKDVARYFEKGLIDTKKLRRLSNEEVIEYLVRIHGIGRWSAEMFLMFGLARPDVFSAGDLGLRRAIQRQYKLRREPTQAELEKISNKWRPYRTLACLCLWQSVDNDNVAN